MKPSVQLFAAALGATMLSVTAAAAPLVSQGVASGETIGAAAKGDPKPYKALKNAECGGTQCVVNFGKKPKPRHIRLVTCGFLTDEDPQLGAVVFGEGDVQFYLPLASTAPADTGKVGVIAFPFEFTVPADTKLAIFLNATGTPFAGNCTVSGSIG